MDMVGFQNIALHDDQKLTIDHLQAIIENHLQERILQHIF